MHDVVFDASREQMRDSPLQWRDRLSADNPVTGTSNKLLAALPAQTRRQLLPRMKRIPLARRQIIQERNVPLRHAYFIEDGAASVIARAGARQTVEVRAVGSWDMVGIPIVLGTLQSPNRCIVQIAGSAHQISADDLAEAVDEFPELRELLLRYVQSALAHTSQLAVCNTRHRLEQRLARWLLLTRDQLEHDEIPLTHEMVSKALGVRRAGVTKAVGDLERSGLVARDRGKVRLVDRARLEQRCCECVRGIRAARMRVVAGSEMAGASAAVIAGMRGKHMPHAEDRSCGSVQ